MAGEEEVGFLLYLKNLSVYDLCNLKLFLEKNEKNTEENGWLVGGNRMCVRIMSRDW